MGSSELLPCPFCGGEASVVDHGDGSMSVGCGNSRCLGFTGLGWLYKTEEQAIEAWNTRAETRAERDLRDEVNWLNSELHGAEMGRTCRIKNTTDICNGDFYTTAKCSRCRANYTIDFKYLKFCPNCGARVVS